LSCVRFIASNKAQPITKEEEKQSSGVVLAPATCLGVDLGTFVTKALYYREENIPTPIKIGGKKNFLSAVVEQQGNIEVGEDAFDVRKKQCFFGQKCFFVCF
jgi:hypothetical protein